MSVSQSLTLYNFMLDKYYIHRAQYWSKILIYTKYLMKLQLEIWKDDLYYHYSYMRLFLTDMISILSGLISECGIDMRVKISF